MGNIKKILFFVTILFFLSPCIASAHVLVTDNNIGAVLHIDPEDDPIAGKVSSFFFEFKDTTNKFNPADCDCNFFINQHGQTIYSQPLFKNTNSPSLTNASAFYTFPSRDVYDVHIIGKPTKPGEFQSFALTFHIRVERSAIPGDNTSSHTVPVSWYILLSFIVLLVLFVIFMLYKDKKKKHKDILADEYEKNITNTY